MKDVHLRSLDLNLMPVFEAVYETGGVASAAVSLGMTQPAVSHALRRLREALSDELFVRQGRRMKPTPKAESLMPMIRGGLDQFQRVLAGAQPFDAATSARVFRVAMPDYVELMLLPKLLKRLRREAPGVRLQTRRPEALFVPPEDALQRGNLDAALSFFPDVRGLSSSLYQEEVYCERNVVVGRRGNPGLRKPVSFEQFAALPQAAVIYGEEPRGFIDRQMAARGRSRRLALATPSFLTALRIVAESDLVAVLPEGLARRFGREWNLVWAPVPLELPEFVLRLVWPKTLHDDREQSWFRAILLDAGRGAV